jgi:hypothetical protein
MSFGDPPFKRPFDLVQLAQFIGEKRLCPVMRYQHAHLVFSVDAPRIGSGFYQSSFGVLTFTKENGFAEDFGEHHAERQQEQCEQARLVRLERDCKSPERKAEPVPRSACLEVQSQV